MPPLEGRWPSASEVGGSVLGSIGHSPSHALQRDSPLLEGAKAVVRLPYAETGGGGRLLLEEKLAARKG